MTESSGSTRTGGPAEERRRLESLLTDVLRSAYVHRVLASTEPNRGRAAAFERIAEEGFAYGWTDCSPSGHERATAQASSVRAIWRRCYLWRPESSERNA